MSIQQDTRTFSPNNINSSSLVSAKKKCTTVVKNNSLLTEKKKVDSIKKPEESKKAENTENGYKGLISGLGWRSVSSGNKEYPSVKQKTENIPDVKLHKNEGVGKGKHTSKIDNKTATVTNSKPLKNGKVSATSSGRKKARGTKRNCPRKTTNKKIKKAPTKSISNDCREKQVLQLQNRAATGRTTKPPKSGKVSVASSVRKKARTVKPKLPVKKITVKIKKEPTNPSKDCKGRLASKIQSNFAKESVITSPKKATKASSVRKKAKMTEPKRHTKRAAGKHNNMIPEFLNAELLETPEIFGQKQSSLNPTEIDETKPCGYLQATEFNTLANNIDPSVSAKGVLVH
mmetsp:Transcript_19233/g.25068  ORF Transcript_19233/g.25068 Transcript_19233/m.25068 type:complete len:345 (-) Transcript_19233:455-1489(-)